MSKMLDEARAGGAMLGTDTEVGRAREHRPLSRGSSDGPQPYQGRPSVGPVPPSRCGPATFWKIRRGGCVYVVGPVSTVAPRGVTGGCCARTQDPMRSRAT